MLGIEITDEETVIVVPGKWVICSRCDGNGSHTNPAVDGHGITTEEMDELGPDFLEDYLSGVYDITCTTCNGAGKVVIPDQDRCAPEHWAAWERFQAEEAAYRAEVEAERRMGA